MNDELSPFHADIMRKTVTLLWEHHMRKHPGFTREEAISEEAAPSQPAGSPSPPVGAPIPAESIYDVLLRVEEEAAERRLRRPPGSRPTTSTPAGEPHE